MTHKGTTKKTDAEILPEEIVIEDELPVQKDPVEEIKRLQDSLARSQADYQNFVMRTERDKTDMVHFLSAKILLPFLTQVDNLERAVKLKE